MADLRALCAMDRLVMGSTERRSSLTSAIATRNCIKATRNGEVVGFMVLDRTFFGHLFISFLNVHPGHRREGVGSALLRYAESIAPTDRIYTSTNQSNTDMQKFCEKHGFIPSGSIENLDEVDPEIVYYKPVTERQPSAARAS